MDSFYKINFFKKIFQEYHQSVNILSGLIWVEAVCKGYQQTTKVTTSRERVEEYSSIILEYIFLFLHKIICCEYSLEAPHLGTSNEYPQSMFFNGEMEKIIPGNYHQILLNKPTDHPKYTGTLQNLS